MESPGENKTIPKNRAGGAITDPHGVQLHSNDFLWEAKFQELDDDEKKIIEDYIRTSSEELLRLSNDKSQGMSSALVTEVCMEKDFWDSHYQANKRHFPFKNYIFLAFPMLRSVCHPVLPKRENIFIVECGCGTGSTLLPLMKQFTTGVHFVGFDVSATAVSVFVEHPLAIEASNSGLLTAFCFDITGKVVPDVDEPPKVRVKTEEKGCNLEAELVKRIPSFIKSKASAVLLVFVLSSLPSLKSMIHALKELANVMSKEGLLCFRDYGIADHSLFRFVRQKNNIKNGMWFQKGDGTCQMFFDLTLTRKLFALAGFEEVEGNALQYHCNRLINRKNGKRMDKIFINGTFRLSRNFSEPN